MLKSAGADLGLLALTIVAAYGAFALFPGLDRLVSSLFYNGQGFAVEQIRAVEAVRIALHSAENVVPFVALALCGVAVWRGPILRLGATDWLYGLCVFVIAPGLMANVITKPLWGRARPANILEFGGTLQYSQPWQFSDQCQAGCSFVSGEMAGATALALVLAMILQANPAVGIRAVLWSVIWAIPCFTAWQRIAAGRHFLSDVVFGCLFTLVLASLVSLLFPHRRAAAKRC